VPVQTDCRSVRSVHPRTRLKRSRDASRHSCRLRVGGWRGGHVASGSRHASWATRGPRRWTSSGDVQGTVTQRSMPLSLAPPCHTPLHTPSQSCLHTPPHTLTIHGVDRRVCRQDCGEGPNGGYRTFPNLGDLRWRRTPGRAATLLRARAGAPAAPHTLQLPPPLRAAASAGASAAAAVAAQRGSEGALRVEAETRPRDRRRPSPPMATHGHPSPPIATQAHPSPPIATQAHPRPWAAA